MIDTLKEEREREAKKAAIRKCQNCNNQGARREECTACEGDGYFMVECSHGEEE